MLFPLYSTPEKFRLACPGYPLYVYFREGHSAWVTVHGSYAPPVARRVLSTQVFRDAVIGNLLYNQG